MYDGIDRCLVSDDPDHGEALTILTNFLGFSPQHGGLRYAIRLYAGGSGVDDRVAVRCHVQHQDWPAVARRLRLVPIEDAGGRSDWLEELLWLFGAEEGGKLREHACRFVAREMYGFQDAPDERWAVYLSDESNVNSWCAVWAADGIMNCLSFDQG